MKLLLFNNNNNNTHIQLKTQEDNTDKEFVYVMSNPSFEANILKVGWSRKHPEIRASTLFTSGLPTPFVIEFIITTCNGSNLETQIHNHIKEYRVNDNREFFKIPKDDLYKILTEELNLEISTNTLDIPTNIKSKKILFMKLLKIMKGLKKS